MSRKSRVALLSILIVVAVAAFLRMSAGSRGAGSDAGDPGSVAEVAVETTTMRAPPFVDRREAAESPVAEPAPTSERASLAPPVSPSETPVVSIRGHVLDEKELPAGGVKVLIRPLEGPRQRNAQCKTDARGAFEFTDFEPGVWVVEPSGMEIRPGPAQVVDATLGSVSGVELRVTRGECLSGRVRWPDGTPVSEFHGWLQFESGGRGTGGRDGVLETCGLPPGEVTIEVRSEESGKGSVAQASVMLPQSEPLELVLLPQAVHPLRGRVLDGEGRPVPDALVYLYTMNEKHELPVAADGSFEHAECGTGRVRLRAELSGWWSEGARVEVPDTRTVELVLLKLASVAGTVLSPSGEPVLRARVAGSGGTATLTDPEGRFTLACPPGRHSFSASAEGYAKSEFVELELGPGAMLENVRLPLRPSCAVRGRVLDASGQPLVGAQVNVGFKRCVSDAQGEFTCDELAPGPTRIFARVDITGAEGSIEVELLPVVPNEVELRLEAVDPFALTLQLLRDGAPQVGALELRARGFSRREHVGAGGAVLTLPKPGRWRGAWQLGREPGAADLENTRLFELTLAGAGDSLLLEWNELSAPASREELARWLDGG